MEDTQYNQNLLPDIDDLFSGDHNMDIDGRYKREATLDVGESQGAASISRDIYQMLSNEIESERYQIRTPEQQASWAEQKSSNTKTIAKYLLRMDCVVYELLAECEKKQQKMLFGVFKTVNGNRRLDYCQKMSNHDKVKKILLACLNDEDGYDINTVSNIIVDEYNLSYANFVRDITIKALERFEQVKAAHDIHVGDTPVGENLSFFESEESAPCVDVQNFEDDAGLDWPTLITLMRNVRLLHLSAERLKERLVSTNLRSVLKIVMNNYHRMGGPRNINFDTSDLIDEAVLGLMHAADMYVFGNSARFTTYADSWIRLGVTRYIKDNNVVRVPVHVSDDVNRIVRLLREYAKEGHDIPLTREDAQEKLKKKFSESLWQLAQNRFAGVSISISCVTNDGDESDVSFDIYTDPDLSEVAPDVKIDAGYILDQAKSLIGHKVAERAITQEQYEFLRLQYVDDLKNAEIAQIYADQNIETKYVRTEIARAISKIRLSMEIK